MNFSKYQNTVPKNLFDALTDYSSNLPIGRTFEQVMTLWTEQPGFPVVQVDMAGNNAVLTQVS